MLPPAVERYLHRHPLGGPWSLEGCARRDFIGAVVIPALAEETLLFDTLLALFAQPPLLRDRFLIVVVVNHRADASAYEQENNRRTLRRLSRLEAPSPLAWVDAAAPGRELPDGQGVGTARKIGCDLSLARLDWSRKAPVLACLDADTLVQSDYLGALLNHFSASSSGGAVIPFAHQKGGSPPEHGAIVRYELFLRAYVLGLSLAGSPYAYHTVGSTIACRAESYVRAGGMNRRTAGEDFYFLQQLAKTCGVSPLRGTVVRPSARPSARTPFGTGRSVMRQLAADEAISFYHPAIFRLLGEWLRRSTEEDPLAAARGLSPEIARFLQRERFPQVWERLRRNHRGESLQKAFHDWFDALKTLRLVHHLSADIFPRGSWRQALPPLLEAAGVDVSPGEEALLQRLRHLQGVETAFD